MGGSAAAPAVTKFEHMYPGQPEAIARVRDDVRSFLSGNPAVSDAVLVCSELSANAATHSESAGDFFIVKIESHAHYVFIEIEDGGGYWPPQAGDDVYPHGLQLVELLTGGADGWGIDGDMTSRTVWARLLVAQ